MEINDKLREAVVLLVLEELDRRKLAPIREFELHQLVRSTQTVDATLFPYINEPIPYSFDLHSFLKGLEKHRYLDELVLMRDGWVPRLEYQLSPVGRAQALEDRELVLALNPNLSSKITEVVDKFASSYKAPAEINPR